MACTACQKAAMLVSKTVKTIVPLSVSNYYISVMSAYGSTYNPKQEQIDLAKKRSEVCLDCEHIRWFGEGSAKSEVITFVEENFADPQVKQLPTNHASCSACGCPLFAKVFADTSNPSLDCPYKKWNFTVESSQKSEDISLLNPQKEQEPQTDSE